MITKELPRSGFVQPGMDATASCSALILRRTVLRLGRQGGLESASRIPPGFFNFRQPTPLQNHRQRERQCRIGDTGRASRVALAKAANATELAGPKPMKTKDHGSLSLLSPKPRL